MEGGNGQRGGTTSRPVHLAQDRLDVEIQVDSSPEYKVYWHNASYWPRDADTLIRREKERKVNKSEKKSRSKQKGSKHDEVLSSAVANVQSS